MTANQFIDAFGGTTAVARLLNIKAPSVHGWRGENRTVYDIPEDKLIRLAPMAEARGIATRKELRPDDWHLIWPELAPQEAPTPGETTPPCAHHIER